MEVRKMYSYSNQGPYLQVNEDSYSADILNGLFVVYDGFGGGGVGDKAVTEASINITTVYKRLGLDEEITMPFYYNYKYLLEGNALINAVHYAHKELYKKNQELNLNKRGGVSLAGLSLSENLGTFVGVGNCRLYLCRNGRPYVIYRGDSLLNVSKDLLELDNKTIPLNALGLFEVLNPSVFEFKIIEDDLVFLCSDGVYSKVSEDEINYASISYKNELSKMAEYLVSLANSRGNYDNQTMLILEF